MAEIENHFLYHVINSSKISPNVNKKFRRAFFSKWRTCIVSKM